MTEARDFWYRRRAAVAAEAEEAALIADREAADLAVLEEKDDAEILAGLDLPDPNTLELGDNIQGFISKAVPDRTPPTCAAPTLAVKPGLGQCRRAGGLR